MLSCIRTRRGLTLIEVLVVVIILSVLVSVAIPLYLRSVRDSERATCKNNMATVATAVQAKKVRDGSYYSGVVDEAAVAPTGDLRDLQPGVPICPADSSFRYTVTPIGDGFKVECGNPQHTFFWQDGGFIGD
jgi:type IV pilus assembly protein PilA